MPVNDAVTYARKQFRAGKDAQQVAEAMTSIALKRYTADNVGVVVVDLRRDGGGGSNSSNGSNGSNGGGSGTGGGGSNGNGKSNGTWPKKGAGRAGLFGGLFGGR
jgi:uncharacterized membrane protein YgcG